MSRLDSCLSAVGDSILDEFRTEMVRNFITGCENVFKISTGYSLEPESKSETDYSIDCFDFFCSAYIFAVSLPLIYCFPFLLRFTAHIQLAYPHICSLLFILQCRLFFTHCFTSMFAVLPSRILLFKTLIT